MACFYAPNGQISNLYEEAKSLYGERKAKEIWYKVRTPEFLNEFGNWIEASKELSLYTKDSFEYNSILASYNISEFVDTNFEPKLMYLNNDNLNRPFKSKLSSFLDGDKIQRISFDSKLNERKLGKLTSVDYQLKSVDTLLSDKANEVFKKGEKNKWSLDKILTELQIPKQQKQLILDMEFDTYYDELSLQENIALQLANNYTYSVQINNYTDDRYSEIPRFFEYNGFEYRIDNHFGTHEKAPLNDPNDGVDITEEEFNIAANNAGFGKDAPSRYYSTLTVPGGTNYTENEIATPGITPSIKGHAQFATNKGIGWFRSDEQITNGQVYQQEEDDYGPSILQTYDGTPTKTRRILEVQSDLFQKGRNKNRLTVDDESVFRNLNLNYIQDKFIKINPTTEITKELKLTDKERKEVTEAYKNRETKRLSVINMETEKVLYNGFVYTFSWDLLMKKEKVEIVNKLDSLKRTPITDSYIVNSNLTNKITDIYEDKNKYYLKSINNEVFEINKKDFNPRQEIKSEEELQAIELENKNNQIGNQFLQLLNKDNNWITFFVKSIIQDSAKKGYEKVLFPVGDTAAKIEGHETVTNFIKSKENRINELNTPIKIVKNEVYEKAGEEAYSLDLNGRLQGVFNTKKEAQKEIDEINKNKKAEIQQLEKEIEDAKAGRLKISSIANFYETAITNVLKKQGYNPKRITDEYGNSWNEIEIIPERDLSNIKYGKLTSNEINDTFESNPELANQVYEALGFKKEIDKQSIYPILNKTEAINILQDRVKELEKELLLSFEGKGKRSEFWINEDIRTWEKIIKTLKENDNINVTNVFKNQTLGKDLSDKKGVEVFELESNNVLKVGTSFEKTVDVINAGKKVNSPRIHPFTEFHWYKNEFAAVATKAKGVPLKKEEKLTLTNLEKQNLYSDLAQIENAGLTIDISKHNNFYYNKGEGIHFIDLGVKTVTTNEKNNNFFLDNFFENTSSEEFRNFKKTFKSNKITPQQEQQAKQLYSQYFNTTQNQFISPADKVIFGHPGIGKTFLRDSGKENVIDFDSDYKSKINEKFGLEKGFKARNEFQKTNKEEYLAAIRELWNQAKEEAQKTKKQLFASDMVLLREFANDFDKVITMSKETFIQRAKQRNDYTPGEEGTEGWKNSLDIAISKIDKSKVFFTDKYLSDLFRSSKQDIEGFKDFVKNQPKKFGKLTSNEFNNGVSGLLNLNNFENISIEELNSYIDKEINDYEINLKKAEEYVKTIDDTYDDSYDKYEMLGRGYDDISILQDIIGNFEYSKVILNNIQNYDEDSEIVNNLFNLFKTGVKDLALNNRVDNLNLVKTILVEDVKKGKLTQMESVEDLTKKINESNLPEFTKVDLKELLKTGDDLNIRKVINFIDDEEDELPRESLEFKDNVSGNTEPFFITTKNIKKVDKVDATEIDKAKAYGYDVVMSDKEIHVINPKVIKTPLLNKTISLKNSPIEFALDIMNDIISTSKIEFKKDYNLNKEWSLINGILNYNPSMITRESKVVPLITLASGLLRKNNMLSTMIESYGNKEIIDNYKFLISKDKLDSIDYENITFEHLNNIQNVKNKNLLLFLDPIVSQALSNIDKKSLDILSTTEDFNNENLIKFGKLTEEAGEMEKKVVNKSLKVTFDSSLDGETPHAKLPKRSHNYIKEIGEKFDYSVTSIAKQHNVSDFDNETLIRNNINNNKNYKTWFDDLSESDQKDFINAVLQNKFNIYRNLQEDEIYEEFDEFGRPFISQPFDKEIFDKLGQLLYKSEIRQEIGTQTHSLIEDIMKKDKLEIDKEIKGLEKEIKTLEAKIGKDDLLPRFKDRPKLRKVDTIELSEDQKKLDKLYATVDFYNELLSIRNNIEERGGRILTEVLVYTDKLLDKDDASKQVSLAGQIDMLVIYEDNEDVDPEYRGKVEIYDFKTTQYEPKSSAPYYEIKNNYQYGFNAKKQANYSLQLMLYQRILEEEFGFEVKDSFLIPITIPEVSFDFDTKELSVDGHFEISKVNEYKINEEPSGKITLEASLDKDGKPNKTPLLNIKTFYNTPYGKQGSLVYNTAKRIAYNRIKSKYNIKFGEEEVKKEKEDFTDISKLMSNKQKMIDKLIDDIKIYLEKRLNDINKSIEKDPKKESKQRAEINKIKTDITDLDKMQSLNTFIHSSYIELYGTETMLGLKDKFELIINSYNQGDISSSEAIRDMEEIRMISENYNILDEIMNALLEGTSDKDLNELKKTDSFKQLETAIEIKKKLLDVRYDYEMKRILSTNLELYLSDNLNKSVDDFIKGKQIQYENKKNKLKELIEKDPKNKENYIKRLKTIESKQEKNLQYFKDVLIRDANTLVRDFTQLNRDIGFIERWATAPISTSSAILSTYAMMLKFQLTEAEWNMKDIAFDIQQAAKKLSSAVFDQGMFNFMPSEGDNPAKFYDPILETVKEWVRDPVTGKLILAETVNLVSEYGTRKYTYVNEEGKTVEDEMTYVNIIKHFQYRMRKLRDAGKFDEFRKLKKEYETWMDKNMERPNINEYYEMNKLFTKDAIGIEAKKRRDEILSMMDNIKDRVKHRSIELTDDDIAALRELQVEYKLLGSIYDNEGNKKQGTDYDVAIRIQEFNKEYNKRHKFVINQEAFEDERRRAKLKFESEPSKYKLWLEENTEIKMEDILFDKVKYLRKLKKILKFAKNNNDYDLMDEITLLIDNVNDFKSFSSKIDSWFKEFELDNVEKNRNDEYEINEEINDLLKPYRIGATHIDTKIIPSDVIARLKELEDQLSELFLANKVTSEQIKQDPSWSLFFSLNDNIQDAINEIIEYVPNKEYYKRYELEKRKADRKGINFEETEWYLNNHIQYTKEAQTKDKPIRAWMTTLPTYRSNKISELYNIDKDAQTQKIKNENPKFNSKAIEAELKKTEWYLKNHEENGDIKEESGYLLIDETLTEGVKLVPNHLYTSPEIKEEYIRKDLNNVVDDRGYLLPKKQLWINSKYEELKLDTKWKDFYDVIVKKYREAQADMPVAYRLGNKLPYIYKSSREELIEGKLKQRAISWWQTTFGNNATRELENDNIMQNLSSSGQDVDLDEDQAIEGIPTYSTSLEKRSLPFRHVYHIDIENVSRDVVSSILTYIQEAERFKAKSEILPQMRALLNLTSKRDKSTEGGVIKRNANDEKLIDGVAKKLGIQKFVRKEGETYEFALIKGFTEMQFFDDQNTEMNFEFAGRTFRIDKLLDLAMTTASFSQIGGITSSGWLKGFANSLQANTQLFLESWASDHYNLKDWAYAKKLIYYGNNKLGALGTDMIKDFGKITRETLSGQLFDMYDALQGTFKDEYGNDLTASKLNLALRSSSWFINQNIGEIEAAATSMYALLNSYKIINGEVYSLDDYVNMKAKEKGSNLDYNEYHKARAEFNKIKDTLLTSFELNADGKVTLKNVKDPEKFLRSQKNMQIRAKLHGINKDLNGNYNSFDKTEIQRNVFGRLVMMYRKYLVPMARRRFGKTYRNEEIGVIRQGYYFTFFTYLFTDFKKFHKIMWNSIFHQKDQGLQPFEEANIRRAMMEIGIYAMLGLLLSMLAPGDDEDKDEISSFRWIALYELQRLRKEIGALAPTPTMIEDNWKLLKSPSAFNSTIERVLRLTNQLFTDAYGVYERKTGIFEKGDSKLYAKFLKLFGNITNSTDAKEAYDDLNRNGF